MNEKLIKQSTFISFDGSITSHTLHQRPDRYRHLEIDFGDQPRIPRGGGYSYSAASFGEGSLVQEMVEFNRFLEFEPVAKTVKVESGMTIGTLMLWAIKRELYFPVLPGYPDITIGGCVAVDAHGKNPWKDGTISDWVVELTLFHPAYGYMRLSRDKEPLVFGMTCGGFGLTGVIVDVTLQLVELPSKMFKVQKMPVVSLSEAVNKLNEYGDKADFIYSWHDGAQRGRSLGAGIVFMGTWIDIKKDENYLALSHKRMTAISRSNIPFSLWNRFTVAQANRLFGLFNKLSSFEILDVVKGTFPFASNTLYHRFYGRKGFSEIQVLVREHDVEFFLQKLQDLIDRYNPPLTMMSLKRFRGKQKSLCVSGEGYLIALNFWRKNGLINFLSFIDHLTVDAGGQPNLSKDSRISCEVACRTLPYYEEYKSSLKLFDPLRLFQSDLSTRIRI